jgi:predicted ester cyclase
MSEEMKAIARRWFDEVINGRDLDAIDSIYTTDYVHHTPGGRDFGRDESKRVAAAILEAFAERRATVEDQLAEGDRVATRFTSRGVQTGRWFGIPPTGIEVVTHGILISRIADGRIAEDWELTNGAQTLAELRAATRDE